MSPSTVPPQGGSCFGRLSEQSPLTGCEPKSLIEVSSEHTPIVLLSRSCSLDTNADDLATTLDASDISDVRRLTSPLFSQEREVGAIPFGVSCSQPHSTIGKPRRDDDRCAGFQKSLSRWKRKISRDSESVQDSQMERERMLSEQSITVAPTSPDHPPDHPDHPLDHSDHLLDHSDHPLDHLDHPTAWTTILEQSDIHDFFERKADQIFQGDCAAQTKLSEAQSELDRREWRMLI